LGRDAEVQCCIMLQLLRQAAQRCGCAGRFTYDSVGKPQSYMVTIRKLSGEEFTVQLTEGELVADVKRKVMYEHNIQETCQTLLAGDLRLRDHLCLDDAYGINGAETTTLDLVISSNPLFEDITVFINDQICSLTESPAALQQYISHEEWRELRRRHLAWCEQRGAHMCCHKASTIAATTIPLMGTTWMTLYVITGAPFADVLPNFRDQALLVFGIGSLLAIWMCYFMVRHANKHCRARDALIADSDFLHGRVSFLPKRFCVVHNDNEQERNEPAPLAVRCHFDAWHEVVPPATVLGQQEVA